MNSLIKNINSAYQAKSQCKVKVIKFEEVSKVFRYDKESNKLERLLNNGTWKVLNHMTAHCNGYNSIGFKCKKICTHRLIYCLANECNVDNELVINHIDQCKHNNHHSNLELITSRDNVAYSSTSSTGITSVSLTSKGTSYFFRKCIGRIYLAYGSKSLDHLKEVSDEFDKMLNDQEHTLFELIPDKVYKRWMNQLIAELKKVCQE